MLSPMTDIHKLENTIRVQLVFVFCILINTENILMDGKILIQIEDYISAKNVKILGKNKKEMRSHGGD